MEAENEEVEQNFLPFLTAVQQVYYNPFSQVTQLELYSQLQLYVFGIRLKQANIC